MIIQNTIQAYTQPIIYCDKKGALNIYSVTKREICKLQKVPEFLFALQLPDSLDTILIRAYERVLFVGEVRVETQYPIQDVSISNSGKHLVVTTVAGSSRDISVLEIFNLVSYSKNVITLPGFRVFSTCCDDESLYLLGKSEKGLGIYKLESNKITDYVPVKGYLMRIRSEDSRLYVLVKQGNSMHILEYNYYYKDLSLLRKLKIPIHSLTMYKSHLDVYDKNALVGHYDKVFVVNLEEGTVNLLPISLPASFLRL